VSGFDLNETALKKNISRLGTVNCYDIFQKEPSLRERFDVIFLFDVLEHITDEKKFLDAIVFHLAPAGHLIVNVPACQWAYSEYDRAVGHVRRYSIRSLGDSGALANLRITKCTYWGLPLVPAMVLRKLYLTGKTDQDEITSSGFAVANKSVNRLMGLLSGCEFIPQKLIGTSVTAVFQR
jgi:hypothetical protein